MRRTGLKIGCLVLLTCLTGCHKPVSETTSGETSATAAVDKVVNLYIWADYMAPDTVASFEKQTGIKVNTSYFDAPEVLEGRVMTGHSGFDVVVPTAASLHRQIVSGAYLVLDKQRLPNWANIDASLASKVASADPGNAHALIYTWGSFGLGYNVDKITKALTGPMPDSWRVIFDPFYAKQLAACGISITDDPAGIMRIVMLYLGKPARNVRKLELAFNKATS